VALSFDQKKRRLRIPVLKRLSFEGDEKELEQNREVTLKNLELNRPVSLDLKRMDRREEADEITRFEPVLEMKVV